MNTETQDYKFSDSELDAMTHPNLWLKRLLIERHISKREYLTLINLHNYVVASSNELSKEAMAALKTVIGDL